MALVHFLRAQAGSMKHSHPSIRPGVLALLSLSCLAACQSAPPSSETAEPARARLYWFVPDGLRADRGPFDIFEWARRGELPNLRMMMARGCYGLSRPVFPGHTPVNYATLMTGASPAVHGVADGTMRVEGHPLDRVVTGGFSSFAKRVAPIWVQLEKAGSLVSLQSVPGSTPPELSRGNTILGRWGAWGVDFPALIYQDRSDPALIARMGRNRRLFAMGQPLTRFVDPEPASPSAAGPTDPFEVRLDNTGDELRARIYLSARSANGAYDRVAFSRPGQPPLADLAVGEWSGWIPTVLRPTPEAPTTATFFKLRVIRLGKRGEFRIRVLYDRLHELVTAPPALAAAMRAEVGSIVDYVDNYPPQLIYFPEDKAAFLEEADQSWAWHRRAVPYLITGLKSDVVIQSVYTPNQMLTSRWWLPFIDPTSLRYGEKTEPERAELWREVKTMYRQVDDLLGEILRSAGHDWIIALSSDHGVIPLFREVRLNNLFAKRGWLRYRRNPESQELEIDWAHTQVAYLQMNSVYVNPRGLAGPYRRASSRAYRQLRDRVQRLLEGLRDPETGRRVTDRIWPHEDAAQAGLPEDRVGDLVLANAPPFLWSEDLSEDHALFVSSLKGGYKQGVRPEQAEGMLTPFVLLGPGVKQGCRFSEPVSHADQYATLAHLLGLHPNYPLSGRVLTEALGK